MSGNEPTPSDLERAVVAAMEEAAMRGLCLDGQIEVAAGLVRQGHPDWGSDRILAFVHEVAGLG